MAISVQNEQEAKVLAKALQDGRVPSARREEALAALRSYNDQYHANRQAATEGGFGQQVARKAAIAGEGLAVGVGDVVDLIASPFTGAAYLAEKALGTLEPGEKFFGEDSYGDISSAIDRSIEGPEPVTQFERSLSGFARVVGGGVGGGVGLGRALGMAAGRSIAARGAQRLGTFLSDQPWTQAAGGFLGEGARQLAEGTDQSGGVQLAAAVLGGLTPAAAQVVMRKLLTGNQAARRALVSSMDDADMLQKEFIDPLVEEADLTVALQQAGLLDDKARVPLSAAPPGSWLDGVLRSSPGSARRLAKQAEKAETKIGTMLRTIGGRVGFESGKLRGRDLTFIDPQTAGESVEQAVTLARTDFRKTSSALYNKLDAQVKAAELKSGKPLMVPITRLMNEFQTVAPDTGLATGMAHPLLSQLQENIGRAAKDVNGRQMITYADFVELRKMLGGKMNNNNFFTDPKSQDLARLFREASNDFEDAAKQWDANFSTNILRTEEQARTHYREGRELFDDALAFVTRRVDQKGVAVEDVFQSVVTNSKNAPSRIVALMDAIEGPTRSRADIINAKQLKYNRTLSPDELKKVDAEIAQEAAAKVMAVQSIRAGIIENLAKPLDSSDKAFSLGTFLTSWRRLRPASREAIFRGDPKTKDALERLVKIAERQVASNKAGARTGDVVTALTQMGVSSAVGFGFFGPLGLLGLVAPILGTATMSRLLSNHKAVRWMAESTGHTRNLGAVLAGAASLADTNPELADDLNKFVKLVGLTAEADSSDEDRNTRLEGLTTRSR